MLWMSKKTILAIEAVVDIAYNARPEPVQAREITKRQGVPQRYLEPVMQQLVHAGILKGVRGPKGGYRLARERRRVTLGDVVRVVSAMEAADDPTEVSQSDIGAGVVGPRLERLQRDLMAELDATTIDDLCNEAERLGIGWAAEVRQDFSI